MSCLWPRVNALCFTHICVHEALVFATRLADFFAAVAGDRAAFADFSGFEVCTALAARSFAAGRASGVVLAPSDALSATAKAASPSFLGRHLSL